MYQLNIKIDHNSIKHLNSNVLHPHVTLSTFKEINDDLINDFNHYFNDFNSFNIDFVSLGCFQSTIFIQPIYDKTLDHLSKDIYNIISKYNTIPSSNRYQPYHQLLHLSLARKMEEKQMIDYLSYLYKTFQPFHYIVESIQLCKTSPYQVINIWNLKKNA